MPENGPSPAPATAELQAPLRAPWWLLECAHYGDGRPDAERRVWCAPCMKSRRIVKELP